MARFVDAIDVPLSPEQAFDYVADFSHTAEWDPGVRSARRLTTGAIELGSRFRVELGYFGLSQSMDFAIVEFERPNRLVMRGGRPPLVSIDEISFVPRKGGTRISYEARIELTGLRSLVDPWVDFVFQRIGRSSAQGLRDRFAT